MKNKWFTRKSMNKFFCTILGIHTSCCGETSQEVSGLEKIVLIGSPNVGKSVIFNALTGAYVTVSNYPGTTVEVSRGKGRILGKEFEIIDTPGLYSLHCITDEEKVTRDLILSEKPVSVVHVMDAKNMERMLPLTFQLLEAGLPVVVVLNIMDEAEALGLRIDAKTLERALGVPVIPAVAAMNKGIDHLKEVLTHAANKCHAA